MNLSCQGINYVQQTSSYTIPARLLTNIGINLKQIRLESILLYTKEQEQRKNILLSIYIFPGCGISLCNIIHLLFIKGRLVFIYRGKPSLHILTKDILTCGTETGEAGRICIL